MRITPDRQRHRVVAGAGSSNSQGWSRTRPTGQRSRHSRRTSATWRDLCDHAPATAPVPVTARRTAPLNSVFGAVKAIPH